MTKEELEKEANKQSYLYDTKYSEDYTLEDRLNRPEDFVKGAIKDLVDLLKRKACRDGYIAGAEPREKRIAELEKLNIELKTKKIPQLERKIASIRGCHSVDAKKLNARTEQVERLKKEIAEAKDIIEDLITKIPASFTEYFKAEKERAERFLGWE